MKTMKNTIIFLNLLILFFVSITNVYPVEFKYAVHTSGKDIDFKKNKALKWNDPYKEIQKQKAKTLKWYEDKITNKKYYFINSTNELAFKKKKALKWYDSNNK